MRRLLPALLLLACPLPAYYHFVRYASSQPPFTPIYDKFDLRALPGKQVQYFISLGGPLALAEGDSEAAVLSQIRAAASVWNTVPTSEIRLRFGGFLDNGASMAAPYIQVEFTDELPPGIIAQGGPVSRLDAAEGPDGVFTPIARSVLRLPRDLTSRPSWSERFFLTLVHEFGHTLGLQHTWTSSVMSTEITRAVTKARPLAQDDIAALSVLYPTSDFRKTTGTIQGRVVMNGQGVPLASVVAFSPGWDAVSALTAPDGSYRIEGLPPGPYFVYAHPLPPALAGEPQPVNLELPAGPDGRFLPGAPFDLAFYGGGVPGTPIQLKAEAHVEGIDFQVTPRPSVTLHSVQTYSFYGRNVIKPAVIHLLGQAGTAVFTGYGANAVTSGFSLSVLNAPETIIAGSLRPYASGYLMADVSVSPFSSQGPRHLLFQNNGESYVLPSGLWIARSKPPSIDSITRDDSGRLVLEGQNLSASTSVWVDGASCAVQAQEGRLLVTPPPALHGHRGMLVAFNNDGQSSLFVHGDASPTVSYQEASEPSVSVPDVQIPDGAEMAIEITGSGADFRRWTPSLGLGTSDVAVRKIWATGEGTALAWLAARSGAVQAVTPVVATVGLATLRLPASLTVLPATGRPFVRMSELQGRYLYPGAAAVIPVEGLPVGTVVGGVSASIGGAGAAVLNVSEGAVTVQIPNGLKPGVYLLRLTFSGVEALPAALEVRPAPPIIFMARKLDGTPVSSLVPAKPGEIVLLTVGSLSPQEPMLGSVRVFSGAVEHQVTAVNANPDLPGTYIVEVRLAQAEPSNGALALTVVQGEAQSVAPFLLPYQP
jgi:uncharacterized protein (TIGR03437 family)